MSRDCSLFPFPFVTSSIQFEQSFFSKHILSSVSKMSSTYMGYTKRKDGSWEPTRWGSMATPFRGSAPLALRAEDLRGGPPKTSTGNWSAVKPPSPIRIPVEFPALPSPPSSPEEIVLFDACDLVDSSPNLPCWTSLFTPSFFQ